MQQIMSKIASLYKKKIFFCARRGRLFAYALIPYSTRPREGKEREREKGSVDLKLILVLPYFQTKDRGR